MDDLDAVQDIKILYFQGFKTGHLVLPATAPDTVRREYATFSWSCWLACQLDDGVAIDIHGLKLTRTTTAGHYHEQTTSEVIYGFKQSA